MSSLWTVALDDSGDGCKAVFIIAGCLVGNKADWKSFNKSWRKQLRAEPRIEYFHQKELASMDGEFRQFCNASKWPKPKGKEAAWNKREALLDAIARSTLNCYALALRVPDYERVRNESEKAKKYLDKDPWAYLIQELAFDAASKIVEFDPKAHVAFVAGPHEKKAQYEMFYEGFKAKNPNIAKHLLGLIHGDFRELYSLQAADLIASEAKKCWEESERKDSAEDVFQKHNILSRFIGFNTIHEERLRGVIDVQGQSHPL